MEMVFTQPEASFGTDQEFAKLALSSVSRLCLNRACGLVRVRERRTRYWPAEFSVNNDAKVVSLLQHVTAIQHRRSRDILGKDSGFMLHFTCDLCGRPLRKERFVARIEIYPAYDPDELSVEDLDSDNLAEVAAQLQAEHAEAGSMYDDEAQEHRFDLCPSCHDRYRQDPLGRDALRRTNFSQN